MFRVIKHQKKDQTEPHPCSYNTKIKSCNLPNCDNVSPATDLSHFIAISHGKMICLYKTLVLKTFATIHFYCQKFMTLNK